MSTKLIASLLKTHKKLNLLAELYGDVWLSQIPNSKNRVLLTRLNFEES